MRDLPALHDAAVMPRAVQSKLPICIGLAGSPESARRDIVAVRVGETPSPSTAMTSGLGSRFGTAARASAPRCAAESEVVDQESAASAIRRGHA
jgi:hypothetical protein